jgi:hypothetical protein
MFRDIEKKWATPSGWLTKDEGENGRRDRQAEARQLQLAWATPEPLVEARLFIFSSEF